MMRFLAVRLGLIAAIAAVACGCEAEVAIAQATRGASHQSSRSATNAARSFGGSPFDDAFARWNVDEYSTSPRPYIPNAKAATAASSNLLSAPRNMFALPDWWTGNNDTRVDNAGTAWDGTQSASSITGTGNWTLRSATTSTSPAGTFTIAAYAKRNTGSDQSFTFYKDFGSTRSSTKVATSTWQRFSYTFTQASTWGTNQIGLNSFDGSTGASLLVSDVELYSGSSDLGPSAPSGHLYFGTSAHITAPSYSSGELDASTGQLGLVQFPSHTFSTITVQALFKKVAAGGTQHAILDDVHDYRNLLFASEVTGWPVEWFGSTTWPAGRQFSGLWVNDSKGYHVLTSRYDGTNLDVWIDDVMAMRSARSISSFSVADLFFNIFGTPSTYTGNKYAGTIALWDRALSDSEVRAAVSEQQQRAARSGITATSLDRFLIAEGDSITGGNTYGDGVHGSDHPYVFGAHASPALYGVDYAISFSRIAELNGRASAVDAALPPNRAGRKFILSVLIGTNDLVSLGSSTWETNFNAYLDARRAAGWGYIVCSTLLPLDTATHPGYEALRSVVNPDIRVNPRCDRVVDYAADPDIGTQAAGDDDALYPDNIHPSTTVQSTYMEPLYRVQINSI